ncbi:MAG: response regulator [Planctomycetota bacterium]|jgi:PAS domain S-box-containing protein|nr:response regulator [Planctomycetota bacterium]
MGRQSTEILDLVTEIERLQAENRRLEHQCRSLGHSFAEAQATIDRAKIKNAFKDKLREMIVEEKSKQEKYFNLLLENAKSIIVFLDQYLRFIYCSRSFLDATGIPSFGVINECEFNEVFHTYVDNDFGEVLMDRLGRAMRSGQTEIFTQNINMGSSEGQNIFEVSISPMLNHDSSLEGVLVIFFDITNLEYSRHQADQANRAKSLFLASMSHEIRTPMNAIIGMSELAMRDESSPVTMEYLTSIRMAGTNLLGLINDILDLSKIESGNLQIASTTYSLGNLLSGVINVMRVRIFEKPILFLVDVEPDIPGNLVGDDVHIRQVFFNLLTNAAKYTNEGFIRLSLTAEILDSSHLVLHLTVIDSGIGIRTEDMKFLFDSFSRMELERNRGIEGTGLGLMISQNLCRAMGGNIEVNSIYGKGSTFSATIPQTYIEGALLAEVVYPEKKPVIIYDERELYRESIAKSLECLKVHCLAVASTDELWKELVSGNYRYVMLPRNQVEKAETVLRTNGLKSGIIVLADLDFVASHSNVTSLTLPAYVVSIANALNGLNMNQRSTHSQIRFLAPEARVLVVDDIATNLKIMEGLLLGYHMRVELCDNGEEAVRRVKENHYDLVLMDHMMPVMDGVEAMKTIRASGDGYFLQVPIIVFTANALTGMREKFISEGFSDYLTKPIELASLNRIIERWIPQDKRFQVLEMLQDNKVEVEVPFKVEGLDTTIGLAASDGSKDAYIKILRLYRRDVEVRLKDFVQIPDEDDLTTFIMNVHAVKSASASIGATEIASQAAKLEDAGKAGNLDAIAAALPAFWENLDLLVQRIRHAVGDSPTAYHHDMKKMQTILMDLQEALKNENITQVDSIMEQLELLVSPGDFASLSDLVLVSEFNNAASLVGEWLESAGR